MDKHIDEFLDFVRIDKDAKILDVAAGTGFAGQKVSPREYLGGRCASFFPKGNFKTFNSCIKKF